MALNVSTGLETAAALWRAGKHSEAEAKARAVLSANPADSAAMHLLAVIAAKTKRPTLAREMFDKSLAAHRQPEALSNYALYLLLQGERDRAEALAREALAIQPQTAQALHVLSAAALTRKDVDGAIELAGRAMAMNPALAGPHGTLARIHRLNADLPAAEAEAKQALALGDQQDAALILAELMLVRGEFATGWDAYESRWANPAARPKRHQQIPAWTGGSLQGKRLLLWAEQGAGDTLQFVRFANLLKSRGATVIVECQPQLKNLLVSMPAPSAVRAVGEPLPPVDMQVSMLDAPRYLQTRLDSIPAAIPYLSPDPRIARRWAEQLAASAGTLKKVGLVWAGDPKHARDEERSIALSSLAPLAAVPGVKLFGLQVGRAADAALDGIEMLAPRLTGWDQTAGAVAALDLVISVDTAVAHLAGALGRPVWVLVTKFPDWRWLLEREDSPWYPTARVIRQTTPRQWSDVIARIARELATWAR